jgi:hypothetical protein
MSVLVLSRLSIAQLQIAFDNMNLLVCSLMAATHELGRQQILRKLMKHYTLKDFTHLSEIRGE